MATKKRPARRPRKRRRPKRRHAVRRWLIGVTLLAVAAVGTVVWRLNRDVSEYLSHRAGAPLRLYTAPFTLRTGIDIAGAGLAARLRRLGYRETAGVDGAPPAPGTYRRADGRLEIGVRAFADVEDTHLDIAVRLELAGNTITRVVRLPDGAPLDHVPLEPELLAMFDADLSGERRPVRLEDLPPHVVAAVLAAEDVRFTAHPGIDPVGIARAAFVNLTEGAIQQGGSTITQQLAKNVFLSAERRWSRKVLEAILALILEARLTKRDILETYLNTVYVGRIGSIGLHGIGQAARVYFGQEPAELTVGAAATIAGALRGPNAYSPLRHPERARPRRDRVLATMHAEGWIDDAQLAAARAEPIAGPGAGTLEGAYFVDEVLRRLAARGYDGPTARGISVYTTLDVEMQRAADHALTRELAAVVERTPRLQRAPVPVEGAIVVIEAATGAVRAVTGGADFARSQYNRATRARRQPGSAFKPFVYLTAIDDRAHPLTAASLIRDEPLQQRVGNKLWTPANYDGRFVGALTVRRALAESRNVPAVRVAEQVGLERIAAVAKSAGLGTLHPVPAMALGSEEVSLLDLVGAYTVFPNLGEVARPRLIRGIVAGDGSLAYHAEPSRGRVASAPASYVVSHLLEGVIDEGTGRGVRRLGITRPVAGKTGTTNDARDAWFVGYSPDLVAGVWVGFDDGRPLGLTGGAAALPVWVALMREADAAYEPRSFSIPPGVVFKTVDRAATDYGGCVDPMREAFVAGTEPARDCDAPRVAAAAPTRPQRMERAARRATAPVVGTVRRFFQRLFGGGD